MTALLTSIGAMTKSKSKSQSKAALRHEVDATRCEALKKDAAIAELQWAMQRMQRRIKALSGARAAVEGRKHGKGSKGSRAVLDDVSRVTGAGTGTGAVLSTVVPEISKQRHHTQRQSVELDSGLRHSARHTDTADTAATAVTAVTAEPAFSAATGVSRVSAASSVSRAFPEASSLLDCLLGQTGTDASIDADAPEQTGGRSWLGGGGGNGGSGGSVGSAAHSNTFSARQHSGKSRKSKHSPPIPLYVTARCDTVS